MTRGHELRTYLRAHFDEEPAGLFEELVGTFDCRWYKEKYAYHTKVNTHYDVDVNNMLRITLAPFFGKEHDLKRISERFGIDFVLEIVAELEPNSPQPTPILSLDKDIIAFLHLSSTTHDLDLYI